MTDPPRVALYARVSTSDQSTEGQVRDLLDYAERAGWAVPFDLVFKDEGTSGLRSSRPALDRLRALVRDWRVDVVLAVKLDRLGRSVRGVLDFYEEAEAAGVRVVCTSQGFDTSTAVGRLLRDVLSSVAAFERELIVERTRAGLRRARAEGKHLGRPPRDVSTDTLRRIVELRDAGTSWRGIAQHVRVPAATVRRLYKAAVSEREGVPTGLSAGALSSDRLVSERGVRPPAGKRSVLTVGAS
jgi:DNA invertase Pin-like site-specific DNA recombinase